MSASRMLAFSLAALVLAIGLFLGVRWFGQRVTGPRPDLKFATFVTARPMFPLVGETAELDALIENVGPGALGRAVKVVAFASDPREGGTPERLATGVLEGPLAPGERTRVSLPFQAPEVAGELELYFALDPDGDLSEVSRENNVVMSPIQVVTPRPATPDLVLKEVKFDPAAPTAKRDLAIVAVVANEGDGASRDAATVDLYVNDPIGPRPRLPGTRRLSAPPLEPGQTVEVSARMRFEEVTLLGVYAQVDTDEEIYELDEANNMLGPVVVAVGSAVQEGDPDLVVDAIELDPPGPVLGEIGHMRIRLANRGGADTNSSFSVNVNYGPEGGRGPGFPPQNDEPAWSRDLRFLAAGQSFALPPIAVPFDRLGRWTVEVDVDPYDEVAEGEGEGNNRAEHEFRVEQKR